MVILSVDLKRFDFFFFKDSINPILLDVITSNYDNSEQGIQKIKELLSLPSENFSDLDRLAISLYLRFMDAYNDEVNSKHEIELKEQIINSTDPKFIFLYTGKHKLSKTDKKKIKKVSLGELLKNGL